MSRFIQITAIIALGVAFTVGIISVLSSSGKNAALSYAATYNFVPTGAVQSHLSIFGTPFNYCPQGVRIFSVPVSSGTLYVRNSIVFDTYDSVILVKTNKTQVTFK